MKRFMAVVSLAVFVVALPGCGGGNDSPSNPTPIATPTPAPSFSGTYTGTTIFNVQGQAEVRPTATLTVTHSGNTITYSNIQLSGTTTISFPMGSGTLVGDTVNTATSYQSAGCGTVTSTSTVRFAGSLMNITVVLTSSTGCARSEIRGELRR